MQVRLRQVEADVQWQVLARGPDSSESRDAESLREYFNLHEPLADMSREWAAKDPRFELISPYFPGAHLLSRTQTLHRLLLWSPTAYNTGLQCSECKETAYNVLQSNAKAKVEDEKLSQSVYLGYSSAAECSVVSTSYTLVVMLDNDIFTESFRPSRTLQKRCTASNPNRIALLVTP